MKRYLYTLIAVAVLACCTIQSSMAKRVVAPQMYMFGFAASFSDTIVYFTDIQQVDSAWIDTKSKFLQSRDVYSAQLRTYLGGKKQMANRTCVVFYNPNRAKLEKKFLKMRKLYTNGKDGKQHFDVRYLDDNEFHFKAIDLTELNKQEENEAAEQKQQKKMAKQKRKEAKAKKRAKEVSTESTRQPSEE